MTICELVLYCFYLVIITISALLSLAPVLNTFACCDCLKLLFTTNSIRDYECSLLQLFTYSYSTKWLHYIMFTVVTFGMVSTNMYFYTHVLQRQFFNYKIPNTQNDFTTVQWFGDYFNVRRVLTF